MAIQCAEITQVVNELLIAFQDCNKIKNSDLRKLVELVAAVNTCANGGPNYSTIVEESYSPITETTITYPVDTFHAISINVLAGSIVYGGFTFSQGSSQNIEVTTLNQTPLEFTINPNSQVFVQYIIETV